LEYEWNLTGPNGEYSSGVGTGTLKFNGLAEGVWNLSLRAVSSGVVVAEGTTSFTIINGRTTAVSIPLTMIEIAIGFTPSSDYSTEKGNGEPGTALGTFSAESTGGGDGNFTYTLANGGADNGNFTIEGNVLYVGGSLLKEGSYNIEVQGADDVGRITDLSVSVSIVGTVAPPTPEQTTLEDVTGLNYIDRGDGHITLYWTLPESSFSYIEVYVKPEGGQSYFLTQMDARTSVDAYLEQGKNFVITVYTCNEDGDKSSGANVAVSIPAAQPAAPGSQTVTINLWINPADNTLTTPLSTSTIDRATDQTLTVSVASGYTLTSWKVSGTSLQGTSTPSIRASRLMAGSYVLSVVVTDDTTGAPYSANIAFSVS
jgi:hypothetical protein